MGTWFGNIAVIIALLLVAGSFGALVLLILPGYPVRSRIKRYLKQSGYDVRRIDWREGKLGLIAEFTRDGEFVRMSFRNVFGGHLHAFSTSHGPILLIYFCLNGSINVHDLPSPDLHDGRWPHYLTRVKRSVPSSLLSSFLGFVGAIIISAFTYRLIEWTQEVFDPGAGRFPKLSAAIGAVSMLITIACFMFPFVAPFWLYQYRRVESTISDAPIAICRNCDYDLRGNVSLICPECGVEAEGIRRTTSPRTIPARRTGT
ncbi:MAG: hypothetical protein DHS20C16_23500 [Phycisphaerae bacterium]|nr:MAG: hypothetical protein DHS20C16_23500 [Phycisphaerae bacterium]